MAMATVLAMMLCAGAAAGPSNAASEATERDRAESGLTSAQDERSWSAALQLFVDYDSNIGLTEENAPAPFEYEPALRAGVAGSGGWRAVDGERFDAGVGGYFAQTTTHGDSYADEYGLSTISPRAWAAVKFAIAERPARFQLDYRYRRDWLEGDDFERSHGMRASLALSASERFELGAEYGISLDDFDASGFHALDARRDAEHHRAVLRATWRPARPHSTLTVGYEHLRNLAEERDFDFDGNGVFARFRTALRVGVPLGLDLLAAYTGVDYPHFTTTPRREARTQRYRAALALPLTRKLAAGAAYEFLRVGADQARFRSKRHLVSLSLTHSF
jgi:hypothetical protein